ncbi:MAG: hypothetical protein AAF750_00480 [Planctomycetota bacterium]
MTRVLPLLLVATLCLSVAACQSSGVKGTPMIEPAPVDITGLDKDKVSKAVFAAVESRGFIFESGTSTSMQVGWARGKYTATWEIDFAGDEVILSYVDSQELSYNEDAEGNPFIHRTYNTWTTNLRSDIAREVGKLRFSS